MIKLALNSDKDMDLIKYYQNAFDKGEIISYYGMGCIVEKIISATGYAHVGNFGEVVLDMFPVENTGFVVTLQEVNYVPTTVQ